MAVGAGAKGTKGTAAKGSSAKGTTAKGTTAKSSAAKGGAAAKGKAIDTKEVTPPAKGLKGLAAAARAGVTGEGAGNGDAPTTSNGSAKGRGVEKTGTSKDAPVKGSSKASRTDKAAPTAKAKPAPAKKPADTGSGTSGAPPTLQPRARKKKR